MAKNTMILQLFLRSNANDPIPFSLTKMPFIGEFVYFIWQK